MQNEKICTKCGEKKLLSEFYWKGNYKFSEYYRSICKKCCALSRGQYIKKHKKQYQQYNKQYREEHREKINEHGRKYYQDNKEKINNKISLYRKNNRDKINARISRRVVNDPCFRLQNRIRTSLRRSLKMLNLSKNNRKTFQYISCTLEEFKTHFNQYIDKPCIICNCNYDNTFEIDHIIPISLANTETKIKQLNSLKNLRLICKKCNRDKRDKIEPIVNKKGI